MKKTKYFKKENKNRFNKKGNKCYWQKINRYSSKIAEKRINNGIQKRKI